MRSLAGERPDREGALPAPSLHHPTLPDMTVARTLAHVLALGAIAGAAASPARAQQGTRLPITQDVYDGWRSIQGAALSPDGAWAAYTLAPQVGDGEVVARSTAGPTEHRASRGFVGRPQLQPAADSNWTAPPAQFTADSRHLLYLAYASRAEFERARRAKKKPGEMPKASLAIMSLADGKVTLVPRVKSFRLAKQSPRWVAYLLEPADSAAVDTAAARPAAAGGAAAAPGGAARPVGDSASRPPAKKEYGSVLVVRDLASGAERRIEDVTAYTLDERGSWLGYTVSSHTPARDGAYVRALADDREHALLSGAGSYKLLAFDRDGRQVAFVANRGERPDSATPFALYYAALTPAPKAALRAVRVAGPAGLPDSLRVSDRGRLEFTRGGQAVVFGLAPAPLDSIPADSLADKAVFDLWHYRDDRLQPQQRIEAARDRDRSHTAAYLVADRRLTRLGSDSLPQITVSDDGRVALAVTPVPYAVEAMWGEGGSDAYVIDVRSGRRKKVATRVPFGATLSPGGRYVTWFDDGKWWSYATATGRTTNLTGALASVRFDQETWDTPGTPEPWGIAGWTEGDRSVLLNARYDVWEVDPAGARPARVVTDSAGVRGRLVFRVVTFDPDERFLDSRAPLYLRAFHDSTKASGFYRERLDRAAAPERLVFADRAFGPLLKAKTADVFAVTQGTFTQFPDLWAGRRLDSLARLSDANPQQSRYRWGTAELVSWRNDDGKALQGILYKPDGFDPAKRYPMVVYFYESLSDNLHQYHPPFGRNTINPTVYSANGYLVFFPDIAYTQGFPGKSALKSVVPGVQALVARGFVDPAAIGIAGQSWGGYQTAYIITQTHMFAAAVPNATVANMTSAYGGIRWETGLARAFQYEKTQSRIGGSLWEYPERYIENSPLFFADRIETPVLMMSNDNDGAVPWYQGIEMFVALRRLGKEAYLINYNGDGHNPRKRANQLDIDRRMQQFFAHHLRGEPAPDWMRVGIPFLRKGRDQLAPAATAGTSAAAAGTTTSRQEPANREP
jgi:dipeptidyl aminopeptidase/acylaminoacyl peptidase